MASSAVEAAAIVGASRSRYSVAHLFLSSRSFLPDGLLNRQYQLGAIYRSAFGASLATQIEFFSRKHFTRQSFRSQHI